MGYKVEVDVFGHGETEELLVLPVLPETVESGGGGGESLAIGFEVEDGDADHDAEDNGDNPPHGEVLQG